jgi:serine/threonine protein kinase
MSIAGEYLNGRYRIDGKLGAGGFASVYRGLDTNTGQAVAIKILTMRGEAYDAEDVARFENEVYITAKLRSPYVVKVLERGTQEIGGAEYMWYVARLIEGMSLNEYVKRRAHDGYPKGVMTPFEVQKLMERVAIVLDDGHTLTRPVIHRDLKPQNIMITGSSLDRMEVYVLDYGVAKIVGGDATDEYYNPFETQADKMLGTPAYMAPEFLTGSEVATPAIDLYALGMVAFYCLTGGLPFESLEPQEIFLGHLTKQFELPERLRDCFLAPVVYKLLEKDLDKSAPKKRYQSAAELLVDLHALKRTRPMKALNAGTPSLDIERVPGREKERTDMLEGEGLGVVRRITQMNTAVVDPDVHTVKLDADQAWSHSYGDRRTVPQLDSEEIERRLKQHTTPSTPSVPEDEKVAVDEVSPDPRADEGELGVADRHAIEHLTAPPARRSESSSRGFAALAAFVVVALVAAVALITSSGALRGEVPTPTTGAPHAAPGEPHAVSSEGLDEPGDQAKGGANEELPGEVAIGVEPESVDGHDEDDPDDGDGSKAAKLTPTEVKSTLVRSTPIASRRKEGARDTAGKEPSGRSSGGEGSSATAASAERKARDTPKATDSAKEADTDTTKPDPSREDETTKASTSTDTAPETTGEGEVSEDETKKKTRRKLKFQGLQ